MEGIIMSESGNNDDNIQKSPIESYVEVEVPIDKIKLNPHDRIRKENQNYNDATYIGIRESMRVFGLWHAIILQKKGDSLYLIAGYKRYCSAFDLGWKVIKANIYSEISRLSATFIELAENNNRQNFSNFEFYSGLRMLKEEFEKIKIKQLSLEKSDLGSFFSFYEINFSHSFVSAFHKLLGFHERILRRKTRIVTAIIEEVFDEKTMHLFEENKITERQLLNILKVKEAKEKKEKKAVQAGDLSQLENTKSGLKNDDSKSLQKEKISEDKYQTETDNSPEIALHPQKKIEKTLNTCQKILEIKETEDNKSKFLDQLFDDRDKNTQVSTSIRKGIIDNLEEVEKEFSHPNPKAKNQCHSSETISIDYNPKKHTLKGKKNGIDDNDRCESCPKARLFVMECYHCDTIAKCKNCGKPLYTVICQNDFINGVHRFRDPTLKRCSFAPNY